VPEYRQVTPEEGVTVFINTGDPLDVRVRLEMGTRELAALATGAGSMKVMAAYEYVQHIQDPTGQLEMWLDLPVTAEQATLFDLWLRGLSPMQKLEIGKLREYRRAAAAEDRPRFTVVGVDARGLPVLQAPSKNAPNTTYRWSVLRNGDAQPVTDPVSPIQELMAA
jgi:hypothetical protein